MIPDEPPFPGPARGRHRRVPLAIRLPPDLEAWLRAEAAREDRSVTGFIEALLERERGRREVQTKRGKK